MSLPLTSIILVSFHTGDVLMRAINSALQQTAPVELIIIDNGNPEGVKKMPTFGNGKNRRSMAYTDSLALGLILLRSASGC